MERILNDEEKIRRAEEIYYRRNNQEFPTMGRKKDKGKKSIKDRFLLHLIIMLDLAIIVFCIQNKDFIFTKEFLGVLNNYNDEASQKVINFFNGIINEEETNTEDFGEKKDNEKVNEINNEEVDSKEENNENINEKSNSENIGGIANNEKTKDNIGNEAEISSSSINEMELDVNNLKAAYSFINPLKGIVSSSFGSRESEYQNVTGYHTGTDIAADKGTKIKASMQGIVSLVSSEGDYGKHLKIRCNNVTTLYAHCSKIYVKEGQIVAQGQEIAEVGSTGNSTGPHLHFEIRVDERFVDPSKIIKF